MPSFPMIKLENITVRMAGRTLIDGLSLTLNEGHRYGLIGRNGTGKSTFFKILLNIVNNLFQISFFSVLYHCSFSVLNRLDNVLSLYAFKNVMK